MGQENAIHLQIITKRGIKTDVMARYVDVPLINGRYGILKDHAPLLGNMDKGKVRYDKDGETFFVDVESGVVRVQKNLVEVLTKDA